MSLITFRDLNTKGEPTGPTWYLEFDAITVEEFTRSANVTTYPVETGAILSDHYQPQPRQISLQGVVSDTPSKIWTNIEGLQNAASPAQLRKLPLKLDTSKALSNMQQAVGGSSLRRGGAGIPRPIVTTVLPSRRLVQGNLERAKLYIPRFATTLQEVMPSRSGAPKGSVARRVNAFATVLDGLMENRIPVTVITISGTEYKDMMITEHRAPRLSGSGGQITFSLDLQQVIAADPAETTKAAQERQENPSKASKKAKGRRGTKEVKGKAKSALSKQLAKGILEISRGIY